MPRSPHKSNVVWLGPDAVAVMCPPGMTVGTQKWLDFMADYFWNDFCLRTERTEHPFFTWVALMHWGFWSTMDPWN